MRLILLSNEKKYNSIAAATVENFFDVNRQNQPCLNGAAKILSCFVKALTLRITKIFTLCLASEYFSSQQNIKLYGDRS